MATEKRLIDANALVDFLKEQRAKVTGAYSKGRNDGLNVAISAIRNEEICPAVDAVEVVHGRWVYPYINAYGHPCHSCSVCGFKASHQDKNFCPNCGAKMDGDGNGC